MEQLLLPAPQPIFALVLFYSREELFLPGPKPPGLLIPDRQELLMLTLLLPEILNKIVA
jgi:hypothetical protein